MMRPLIRGNKSLNRFHERLSVKRATTLQRAVASVVLSLKANDVILVLRNSRNRQLLIEFIGQKLRLNESFLTGHSRLKLC